MKRFYKDVCIEPGEDGARLLLDGRPVKTPAKNVLTLPPGAFAEAVAKEWRAQGDEVDPAFMPLTRLANTVIDGVAARESEVRQNLCAYGKTDLICHWAEHPQELVARQAEHWQPVLDWAEAQLGARFQPVQGVIPTEQDEAALKALERDIAALDHFALAALHEMTSLTGSVLIALATARGALDAETAWAAAHVDEAFQIEQWGEDEEARARFEARKAGFDEAVQALRLMGYVT